MFNICFHKWGKWSDPANSIMESRFGQGMYAVCQHRSCEKCGIFKYRKLPQIRSIRDLDKGAANV